MGAQVTLLLVVGLSGGEVRPGQLSATLQAQLDPSRVRVQLRRADGVPRLRAVLDAASSQGPVALVSNPRKGELQLEVALQAGQWVQRTFRFSKGDPLAERNRTVALAIAAMVPEWKRPKPEPEPPPENAPAPPPLDESERFGPMSEPVDAGFVAEADAGALVVDAGVEATGLDAGTPVELAVADAGRPAEVARADAGPPEPARATAGLGVELGALAGFWPLAPGLQLGGGWCWEHACAGAILRGQRGELTGVGASLWRGSVMAVARGQLALGSERLSSALQLSLGPTFVLAQRNDQSQSRWQLEVGLEAEVAGRVAGPVWLFVRGGVALASGPTPIFVNDVQRLELPVVSALGSAGIRLGL